MTQTNCHTTKSSRTITTKKMTVYLRILFWFVGARGNLTNSNEKKCVCMCLWWSIWVYFSFRICCFWLFWRSALFFQENSLCSLCSLRLSLNILSEFCAFCCLPRRMLIHLAVVGPMMTFKHENKKKITKSLQMNQYRLISKTKTINTLAEFFCMLSIWRIWLWERQNIILSLCACASLCYVNVNYHLTS